jgi:competence protein ComEA
MKAGREQVFGSFALLAVTAMLIFVTLPSGIPHKAVIPDIPFSIETPGTIAVEIAGESGRNGVYFIPKGTPLAAFLDMAGITAAGINVEPKRAASLSSATTVTLMSSPAAISTDPMSADKRLALGIPIDLNRSSFADLVLVPGIGEKTAERILEDHRLNGTFRKLEDLTRVKGIKEKRLETLRRYLCIGC